MRQPGPRLVIACVVAMTAAAPRARADLWIGGSMGAGAEAVSRRGDAPTGVGALGIHGWWLPDGARLGLGLTTTVLARTDTLFETHLAVTTDLMLRFATADRRIRGGLGPGLRLLTVTPPDGLPPKTLAGVDLVHVELGARLHRWVRNDVLGLAVEGFASWTLGCYRGRFAEEHLRDAPAMQVGCTDTLASTFVVGIGVGLDTYVPAYGD